MSTADAAQFRIRGHKYKVFNDQHKIEELDNRTNSTGERNVERSPQYRNKSDLGGVSQGLKVKSMI